MKSLKEMALLRIELAKIVLELEKLEYLKDYTIPDPLRINLENLVRDIVRG
jgi:hypothetical protein